MGDAMQEAEALELAADAINAGIFNDLGFGRLSERAHHPQERDDGFLGGISQAEQGGGVPQTVQSPGDAGSSSWDGA